MPIYSSKEQQLSLKVGQRESLCYYPGPFIIIVVQRVERTQEIGWLLQAMHCNEEEILRNQDRQRDGALGSTTSSGFTDVGKECMIKKQSE